MTKHISMALARQLYEIFLLNRPRREEELLSRGLNNREIAEILQSDDQRLNRLLHRTVPTLPAAAPLSNDTLLLLVFRMDTT